MKVIYIVAIMMMGMLITPPTLAADNPGELAGRCLGVSQTSDGVTFSNQCNTRIFVIYCGNLSYSSLTCGYGPDGGYYTHSRNLDPNDDYAVELDGQVSYGACVGGIGYGNIAYDDEYNGSYSCNPT